MFGTIVLAKDSMTEEQLRRYQSVYCGLCKVLRDKYGQFHRFTLNFDMTFVVLLLGTNAEAVATATHTLNSESSNPTGDNGGTSVWWDKNPRL